ncbi:3-oxoadipate enol-lactonase [Agrobacterium genomosp. 3]|uniref:3-oxoadipate enol-lactonase n=1 Tax=Agrobacterium tomkonis TaxID=1183410 RepID=UPI001CD8FC1B|nr:3-oxoadipate enol-lactonase [Agrobacterium tomkonis]MCA1879308.1 3-oxoadipate enol-lactonase [Agrobacterium tumefaciens]MCA1894471.1 3-oxoadipate enol-lactonase [Agrobacterium tomkonis]
MTLRPEYFSAIDGLYHGYRPATDSAPVLVFANSLGTDLRVWDRVVALLPQDWGILRHDKRGHGLSAARDGLTIQTMTSDVEVLLDHLGITRFVGVGLSVGGLIMQRLALRRPVAMTHLILADTAAKIGTPEVWNSRIEAVLQDGIASISDAILSRWFAPGHIGTEDFQMWRMMLERTPAEGYAAVCAAIRDADHTDDLGQIAAKTLVLAGRDDASTPPALVRACANAIPGARFVEIADAGHLPCVEQPAVFVGLVQQHVV